MRRIALLLALLLALSLAACGGSASKSTPTQPETEAAEPQTEASAPETEAAQSETEAPATEAPAPETEAPEPLSESPEPEAEATEPQTEAPEAVQGGDDPLAYTVSRNKDGNFEYVFDVLLVTVPGDWEGKYTVERTGPNSVSFYHTRSYEAFQEQYGFGGGYMFGISLEERGVDPEYPSEQYLGYARDGQDYYMVFPTDVQGFMEDEDIFAEWNAMMAEMEIVEQNSYSMLFHD